MLDILQNILAEIGFGRSLVTSGPRPGFGLVDFDLGVPLSVKICLGRWEFGRISQAAGQHGGTFKSKSTQPKSQARWDTLYQ